MRPAGKPRKIPAAPLTTEEARRRAAAVRGALATKPALADAGPKPSAPDLPNVIPAAMPEWVASAANSARGLRITATISITMTDRAARSRSEVIAAAIEALQDAQADGAADEMIAAADREGFDVERIELLATEPQVRS